MLKKLIYLNLFPSCIQLLVLGLFILSPAVVCLAQKTDSIAGVDSRNKERSVIAPLPACCSSPEKEADTTGAMKNFIFSGSAYMNLIAGRKFDTAGFETGFMPVFLYRPSERLYFVMHLHISAGMGHMHTSTPAASAGAATGGHTHGASAAASSTSTAATTGTTADIMLYYANMVYYVNQYLTITGGMFPSPFGIYPERLHLPWQNYLPDAPLGMGHGDQVIPLVELGVQASGEASIQKAKINYALFVSNGPSLTETGTDAGKLSYSNLTDNNKNKTIGGRLGLLPVPNSSLELGFFGQKGKVGQQTSSFSGVDALLYGADISIHEKVKPLKGTIDVKGQYNMISMDKVYYKADPVLTTGVPEEDVNLSDSTYRFNNITQLGFITASYRPTGSMNFLKNTEYILRYDMLGMPSYAIWNSSVARYTAGIVYWLDTRSSVKFSFQTNLLPEQIGKEREFSNVFIMQWEIGL